MESPALVSSPPPTSAVHAARAGCRLPLSPGPPLQAATPRPPAPGPAPPSVLRFPLTLPRPAAATSGFALRAPCSRRIGAAAVLAQAAAGRERRSGAAPRNRQVAQASRPAGSEVVCSPAMQGCLRREAAGPGHASDRRRLDALPAVRRYLWCPPVALHVMVEL